MTFSKTYSMKKKNLKHTLWKKKHILYGEKNTKKTHTLWKKHTLHKTDKTSSMLKHTLWKYVSMFKHTLCLNIT